MYRPGETARFKGWVRRLSLSDDAQLETVSANASVRYAVSDWYGNEIGTGSVDLNALGGFDFAVDIPAGANLGNARVDLSVTRAAGLDDGHIHSFQIQEFRRPEFEVIARPESPGPYFVDEPATVAVDANYFSGGPLPDAEVEWNVFTTPTQYSPPGWDEFTFGEWIPWWFLDTGFGDDVGFRGDVALLPGAVRSGAGGRALLRHHGCVRHPLPAHGLRR